MNTKNWFVYDSLGSEAHYFATEKEALEFSDTLIAMYLDEHAGGWPEEVEDIYMGMVTHRPVKFKATIP